jgi:hypothetical protein
MSQVEAPLGPVDYWYAGGQSVRALLLQTAPQLVL